MTWKGSAGNFPGFPTGHRTPENLMGSCNQTQFQGSLSRTGVSKHFLKRARFGVVKMNSANHSDSHSLNDCHCKLACKYVTILLCAVFYICVYFYAFVIASILHCFTTLLAGRPTLWIASFFNSFSSWFYDTSFWPVEIWTHAGFGPWDSFSFWFWVQ